MTIKYKSYGIKPNSNELYGVRGSFCNKPVGGLWGCRGDEWYNWCQSEDFCIDRLKNHFYFKLKSHARLYKIKTKKDYSNLVNKYASSQPYLGIDYLQMAKDYDAVEVVGDIVYKLRFDTDIDLMGLYAWDVPSICVLNPNVVDLI